MNLPLRAVILTAPVLFNLGDWTLRWPDKHLLLPTIEHHQTPRGLLAFSSHLRHPLSIAPVRSGARNGTTPPAERSGRVLGKSGTLRVRRPPGESSTPSRRVHARSCSSAWAPLWAGRAQRWRRWGDGGGWGAEEEEKGEGEKSWWSPRLLSTWSGKESKDHEVGTRSSWLGIHCFELNHCPRIVDQVWLSTRVLDH